MIRVALIAILVAATAQAQRGDEQARELFEQARHAFETGRFAEARDLLRRSLELTPNAGAAFNLAVAMRGTGEAVGAVDVLDRLLAGQYGELSAEQREQVARLRGEVALEIATLEIHAAGAPRVEVRVDGEPAGEVVDGGVVDTPVDSRRHVVSAHAEGLRPEQERIYVERGERLRVDLRLHEPLIAQRSVFEEPAFWILTGSLLAAVGAALAIGLSVYYGDDGLVRDPVFGNTATLLAR
jgi:hypothetical protein